MKPLLALFTLLFLISCSDFDSEKIKPYQENYKDFKSADYNFSSGRQYYRMKHFNLDEMCDTLAKVHSDLFQDPELEGKINEDVHRWLRDSVFYGSSKTMKGSLIMDTTNMLLLEDPLTYYMQSRIEQVQFIEDQLFQIKRAGMHTANIGDKRVFYDIVPANGKLIEELAEYRIETTGDYFPHRTTRTNPKAISNLRYFCDLHEIDWYISISSDDFFDDHVALKLTDTTYYYDTDLTRQR